MDLHHYFLLLVSVILLNNLLLARTLPATVAKMRITPLLPAMAGSALMLLSCSGSLLLSLLSPLPLWRNAAFILSMAAALPWCVRLLQRKLPALPRNIAMPLLAAHALLAGAPWLLQTQDLARSILMLLFALPLLLLLNALFHAQLCALAGSGLPPAMRGAPAAVLSAALLALALMGFRGLF